MNYNNDESFDFSQKPKKGRRANTSQNSVELEHSDIQIPILSKKAGWADETLKSARNRTSTNLIEQQRFQEGKTDFDDNIPTVPDIEELPDEGLEQDIARAISTSRSSASTFEALGATGSEAAVISGRLAGVALGPLARFMAPRATLVQSDQPWTLLRDLAL